MKFLSITETENLENETLQAEYNQAHQIGKVALGASILFVKKTLKIYYVSYTNIYRAFRRIKAVPARICCGNGEIRLEYLVLCNKKDEFCEIDLPDERASASILEEIAAKAPQIKIGKKE